MSSMITLSATDLVPILRDSLRCQLEAKLGVLLTERQALDIARNVAQAVLGLEIDETHVIDTSRHNARCMAPFDTHLTCPIVAGREVLR